MGTIFDVRGQHPGSIAAQPLNQRLVEILNQIDGTFSDWNQTSELRRLETMGLMDWRAVSPLFFHGLVLAQTLHDKSAGLFDITVGARLWCQKTPIGLSHMQLDHSGKRVRFLKDPQRLTFDGFIKGFAVGRLSQVLAKAGLSSFSVDAGGGDQAQFTSGSITFRSFSGSTANRRAEQLHIYSPTTNVPDPSKHVFASHAIHSSIAEIVRWPNLAAECDATSTVRTLL